MTYVVCLIYVAIIYLRPGELVPAWANLRIAATALAVAGVTAAFSLMTRPRRFANLPIDLCFIGFCLASVFSNPANGRFAGGPTTFLALLPLIAFYLLIRLAVRTERQLRWFVVVLVVLTLFQASNGIVQYWTGLGFGGSTAVVDGSARSASGGWNSMDAQGVRRVQGTGIFGDPNELAMSLVLAFPFVFSAIFSRDPGFFRRALGLGALVTLSYALFLTQSRGGFVGAAAMGAAYAYRRFGRVAVAVVAVAAISIVLATGSSRYQAISSSEESAQGRIQAWSAGLEMLKSGPVLGVGFGEFIKHHERVAHNAFVHVFAEIGLVGSFFFVGMFYWFFVGNGSGRDVSGAAHSPLALDLWASGIGATVCACFLSQQFVPVLYVPLVLGAVRIAVEEKPGGEAPSPRWWDWWLVLFLSMCVVLATYVAVRTLVVWSRF